MPGAEPQWRVRSVWQAAAAALRRPESPSFFRAFILTPGDNYDPWCDRLAGEPGTDKSAPHNGALRVLHDCHQATVGGGTVVLGDKSHAEVWKLLNDGCCLDIGERGQAAGGRDLVVEVKVWTYLHADSTPIPHADLSLQGATHGFGDTLEHAIRKVRGVRARSGDDRWSHARGVGRVSHHPGDYDDAQRRKHNEHVLFLMETSGALTMALSTLFAKSEVSARAAGTSDGRTHRVQTCTQES